SGVVRMGEGAGDGTVQAEREASEPRRVVVPVLRRDPIGEGDRRPASGGVVSDIGGRDSSRGAREAAGGIVLVPNRRFAVDGHRGPATGGVGGGLHPRARGALGHPPVGSVPPPPHPPPPPRLPPPPPHP